MNISDLYSIAKNKHDFKINSVNGSSTLWKKDIYIVKASNNWYRIGISNNVNFRMRTIQGYYPEEITYTASVPLQGMVYYVERKVLETFHKYLKAEEIRGMAWVRLEGSKKDIIETFKFIVTKTVNSLRRRHRTDNRSVEKLITGYKPSYNAISILK
jgi:predicted GIY-YIG superfamily endonuclease